MMMVRGKGGRERLVPLSEPAMRALSDWRALVPETKAFLFPARGKSGHLTRQRLAQILQNLAIAAGLSPTRISPHVYFATPSPPIWSNMVPICVPCSICWVMPIFRQHRFTLMFCERKKPCSMRRTHCLARSKRGGLAKRVRSGLISAQRKMMSQSCLNLKNRLPRWRVKFANCAMPA